ncbi:hypothetical protein [Humibacillus sp. DSM 29435]|uniref:hypothetical protein n=1 Tax=Humibacillus sp. DSM 29435 TaxID=1869167 RepID=UPI0011132077|nr:hypothetical protein [Humibacillus sp. DSM 29435]
MRISGTAPRARTAQAAAGIIVLAGSLLLSGCGDGRSTDAFCTELKSGMGSINARYKQTGNDGVKAIGGLVTNLGEFSSMLHKLDEVAPEEIKSDMTQSVKAWDSQVGTAQEAVKNPLGALAGGLMTGLMSSGSMSAVDKFASANCSMSVFGSTELSAQLGKGTAAGSVSPEVATPDALATPEPETTTTEVALQPGQVKSPGRNGANVDFVRRGGVIALEADGGLGELGQTDQGVSQVGVVDEKTFEVQTVLPMFGNCSWALAATPGGRPLILRARVETTPAAGVNAESYQAFVDATDARTNANVWSTKVPGHDATDSSCPEFDFAQQLLTQTSDFRYASIGGRAWDITTGDPEADVKQEVNALGSWWLTGANDGSGEDWTILEPSSGKRVGTIPGEVLVPQWDVATSESYAPVWEDAGQSVTLVTRTNDNGDNVVSAVTLPSGKIRWSLPSTVEATFHGIDTQTGTIFVGNAAVSPAGHVLWTAQDSVTDWCGASGGKVWVLAATAATLDEKTGKQIGYADGQQCAQGVSDGSVRVDAQADSVWFRTETPGAVLPDLPAS